MAQPKLIDDYTNKKSISIEDDTSGNIPAIYLVVAFLRGHGMGLDGSSVSIPVSSIDQCNEQGAMMVGKNTKMIKTFFWCVEGIK
ncbi:hypothetical protein [Prochlorococcus marinus]|uniref:hypothetical protein n=1 Tax=Prochlorococcus TaxID=1218 RepID=UPI001F2478FD|nr:hypothetical protein [Prochlorococcus marinus]